jgi:hypothetical protein
MFLSSALRTSSSQLGKRANGRGLLADRPDRICQILTSLPFSTTTQHLLHAYIHSCDTPAYRRYTADHLPYIDECSDPRFIARVGLDIGPWRSVAAYGYESALVTTEVAIRDEACA